MRSSESTRQQPMCWRQRHVGLVCCGFSPLFREVFLWVLWSAYHLYGKPENSGENSNGTVHPGGNYPEKKEYLSRYYLFPVLTKRPKFSVPFCLDYQCQASCREKLKNLPVFCKWYNSIPFLLSVPEKYQYHMTEIFTEISVQMGSAPGVPLSSRTVHPNSGTARDAFKRVI